MDFHVMQEKYKTQALARTISDFWNKQGYTGINVRVDMAPGNIFNIISNIGPTGFPPRV